MIGGIQKTPALKARFSSADSLRSGGSLGSAESVHFPEPPNHPRNPYRCSLAVERIPQFQTLRKNPEICKTLY